MSQGLLSIFCISCRRWRTPYIFKTFRTSCGPTHLFANLFFIRSFFFFVFSWFVCLFVLLLYFFSTHDQQMSHYSPSHALTGAHRRTGTTAVQQTFRLKKLFKHEDFDMRQLRNDIALLQLERPITTSEKVNTVCLPTSGSRIPAGTPCYITGYLSI